ncbi:MAG TPA: hypothetical protein PLD43_00470 [Anaerolineae bacterium]|nr:hypothetical protein [Anaerolineae bacterium]
MPDWYLEMAAATRLGVAPWELDEVSIEWRHRALAALDAEAKAAKDRERRG